MLSSAELYFIPLAVNDSMMPTYWRWTHRDTLARSNVNEMEFSGT